MKCPPVVLAATFVLQVAIFYWKFICLIEDTKPNLEHLASLGKTGLGKTGAAFFEGGAWRNWRSCSLGGAGRWSLRFAPRTSRQTYASHS